MTLQERLRELIPNGYGYNSEFAHTMSEAADRIDELEKEPNLLNVAWLQGEFSELQAKVEILLNEHAERGVRIEELEATIRKMAMDSLSVEGQWSDKVDELADACARACLLASQMHRAAMNDVIGPKRGVVEDILDLRAERDALQQQLEAKQRIIDELMIEYCPNEMTPEQLQNYEDHQRPLTDDEKKEDQECRSASS